MYIRFSYFVCISIELLLIENVVLSTEYTMLRCVGIFFKFASIVLPRQQNIDTAYIYSLI